MTSQGQVRLEASVRRRLLNLSRQRGAAFDLILNWYGLERWLYRLGRSEYAHSFVLKGAMLFAVWAGEMHRPTRDLDLLGRGQASAETAAALVGRICQAEAEPDGLEFHLDTIHARAIRETEEYQGQRVRLLATLGKARILLQIDIGFGDAVTPLPQQVEYPTLLDLPAPRVQAYPRETVVAEKLQAMVTRGMVNSRMGDFYDLWWLSTRFSFEGALLTSAIAATFERRGTIIPHSTPRALTERFAVQQDTIAQWRAFLGRNRLDVGGGGFSSVIQHLRRFLGPPLSALAASSQWLEAWPEGGPWRGASGSGGRASV